MGAILKKMTHVIKAARLEELFALWDKDQSGFLEAEELNRVVGIFNGEDWDALTKQEKEEQADKFINRFDAGEGDGKLSPEVRRLASVVVLFPSSPGGRILLSR